MFLWLLIYYAHLVSVRFEHSMCCGSLMTTYVMLLAWLVEHSLVHWYHQCVTVHHVLKCMSCNKAIVVITRRANCFHDCIYITPICFCEIWAICLMWISYDHLYYAPCLACWALFGSLVSAMCNHTSCTQVHELPQSNCGDRQEDTFFPWLYIYIYI